MKAKLTVCMAACGLFLTAVANNANGQLLYSEDFDDGQASNRWKVNTSGMGIKTINQVPTSVPMDTNFDPDADGVADDLSGFSFDYSTVGIPPAPNSGGSTTGMKLQANLFSDAFGGFSVSPLSQSFTGDYVLSYDMWQNFNGPFPAGGSGTTNLSFGGVLTSGTTPTFAGATDGIFFASTIDGGSSADYRAYSVDRPISYQLPIADPKDNAATYFAGTTAAARNNNHAYYKAAINPEPDPVGAPNVGTVTAPAAQLALFPGQTGIVASGAMGMAWYRHEITKVGTVVTWSVNGTDLIAIDLSLFVGAQPTGTNILFGHSDTNEASSTDFNAQFLLFTLIDNVEVNALNAAVEDADFDGDGDVDGRDFLTWQRGFGTPDAVNENGDADGDNDVDGDDLIIWQGQYGTGGPLVATVAVPEPTTLLSFFGAIFAMLGLRRRALSFAPVRNR